MNTPSKLSTGSTPPPSPIVARLRAHRLSSPVDRHLWLALLLTLPAMLTLLAPGYFMKAHDARHSIFFLVEFDQSIREGALWPIWGPDHSVGFGYPTFLVYAPLAYYVGEVFHLLGMGFAAAIKATWALGFLVGAAGAYRLARCWFRPAIALVASLAFTYAPYHLSQIYVRAALAEFMALAWLPWTALAMLLLWDDPRPRRRRACRPVTGRPDAVPHGVNIDFRSLVGRSVDRSVLAGLEARTTIGAWFVRTDPRTGGRLDTTCLDTGRAACLHLLCSSAAGSGRRGRMAVGERNL